MTQTGPGRDYLKQLEAACQPQYQPEAAEVDSDSESEFQVGTFPSQVRRSSNQILEQLEVEPARDLWINWVDCR